MSGDIFLTIDRLILHGLDRLDRHAVSEALQHALREQLAANPNLNAVDLHRVQTDISLPATIDSRLLGRTLGEHLGSIIVAPETRVDNPQAQPKGGQRHA